MRSIRPASCSAWRLPLHARLSGEKNSVAALRLLQPCTSCPALCRASTPRSHHQLQKLLAAAPRGWPGQARPRRRWVVHNLITSPVLQLLVFPGHASREKRRAPSFSREAGEGGRRRRPDKGRRDVSALSSSARWQRQAARNNQARAGTAALRGSHSFADDALVQEHHQFRRASPASPPSRPLRPSISSLARWAPSRSAKDRWR